MLYSKPKIIILKLDKPLFSKVIAFRKVSIFSTKHLFYYVNYGKIIVEEKSWKVKLLQGFKPFQESKKKN